MTFGVVLAFAGIIPAPFAYRLRESAKKLPIIHPGDANEEQAILEARNRVAVSLTSKCKLAIILNVGQVVTGALISGGFVIGIKSIMVYGIPLLAGARGPLHGSSSDPLERISKHLDKMLVKNEENPERIEIAVQRIGDG